MRQYPYFVGLFHTSTPLRSVELRMKKESRDLVASTGHLWPICITSVGLPNVVAVGNNAQHIQWRGCLSFTRLYSCQKTHMDTTGEVMCRLCNKAPKVSPISWMVVLPLHRTSTLPDITQT